MSEHVLVPMDYSPLSKEALRTALADFPDADVTVLHVIDFRSSDRGPGGWGTAPNDWDDWLAEARARTDSLFEEVRGIAADHGRDVDTARVVGEDARSIVDYAETHDVDRIVMGSHGRSLPARILLGSVSESVVRRAPVPVTVVR